MKSISVFGELIQYFECLGYSKLLTLILNCYGTTTNFPGLNWESESLLTYTRIILFDIIDFTPDLRHLSKMFILSIFLSGNSVGQRLNKLLTQLMYSTMPGTLTTI